ncbi:MAG: hypothetical protein K9K36_09780 [Desulfarculaceae bacterium]|nr:hypothetical protein [Desulfarculaceae bacterium]MCF8048219.1 hypothetical protein [Desulfarculaceae bacterium]MCF8065522.1 hypothetical protein [Desulfarculaceae bacterium]
MHDIMGKRFCVPKLWWLMRSTARSGGRPKSWCGSVPGIEGEFLISWWYRWEKESVVYGIVASRC